MPDDPISQLPTEVLAEPKMEISALKMFTDADIVVQVVMIGLIIASVWCWAIIFEKFMSFSKARKLADKFEELFWSGKSMEEIYMSQNPSNSQAIGGMFMAAMKEWKRSQEGGATRGFAGLQMRISKVMDVTAQKEIGNLEKRLLFLATIGSTAPFIGLFGTVWGIMHSFQSIANEKSTSLVVVAPGIAEALFATALGLLAAIPAVVFYNKFSGDLARFSARLENFADEFSAIISRQLDERVAA